MKTRDVKIDLITQRPDGAFVMVLVEQGPWSDDEVADHLRRVQDRLYDYVEAAIDGHLARRFPAAIGKEIWIRLDCYDTPDGLPSFFEQFESQLRRGSAFRDGVVPLESLHFEYHCRSLGDTGNQSLLP